MMEIVKGKIGNAITSTASDHVVAVAHDIYDEQQERYQDDINNYLLEHEYGINNAMSCFGSGVWDNDLCWSNVALWDNNKYAVTEDLQNQIDQLESAHNEDVRTLTERVSSDEQRQKALNDSFRDSFRQNNQEHNAINQILLNHTERIEGLEALSDINSEIEDIHSDISNIQEQLENHVTDNENTIDEICAQSSIFDKGEWSNPFFWNDSDLWFNTPDSLSEVESDVIKHDDRISALEAQFALFAQQYSIQQAIIEQQRQQIETLMDCFTVLNVGKWQNLLLWDNTSKWSDSLITEASADGGTASVAVKSYDPETSTVTI